MTECVPAYVYEDHTFDPSLLQGDILKVDGQFRTYFNEFYPAIKRSDGEIKYVMVLTQSCDLVKTEKRKPKISHINVCLVKSLKSIIRRLITQEIKPTTIHNKNILTRDALDRLKDRLYKLLNNTDQKIHFFLPKQDPFMEDMTATLPLSFSFRIDHYDLLLNNRVLGLKPEFQAKVGYIINQLYGRIGTSDLYDYEWDDKRTRKYINQLLTESNLVQVPDKKSIDYIKNNANSNASNLSDLIQEFEAITVNDAFTPLKNELIKSIRTHVLRLFDDQDKMQTLINTDKRSRAEEIKLIIDAAINDI